MPPKHAMKTDKFDPSFVEFRRAGLEHFLQRVVTHPVLSFNESLK